MWITVLITLEVIMEIKIIVVGKLKEKYLKNGISEYLKRMKSYANLKLIEVKDEAAGQTVSESKREQIKGVEGTRILEKSPKLARVIALDLKGKQLTSQRFSE